MNNPKGQGQKPNPNAYKQTEWVLPNGKVVNYNPNKPVAVAGTPITDVEVIALVAAQDWKGLEALGNARAKAAKVAADAEPAQFSEARTKLAIEIAGKVADVVKSYKPQLAAVKAECCLVTWDNDTFEYAVKLTKPTKKASGKRQPNDGKRRTYTATSEAMLKLYGIVRHAMPNNADGTPNTILLKEAWEVASKWTGTKRANATYTIRLELIKADQASGSPIGSWTES